MSATRLASMLVRTLIKDRLHYPGRLAVDMMSMVARCGVLLLLYSYVFSLRGGEVHNTTFVFVAWSMFFYFAFSTLRLPEISRLIMRDVQSGNVEVLLSKPISYLWYRFWWQVGAGLPSFFVATILCGTMLGLLVGVPPTMTNPFFIVTLLASLLGGVMLGSLLYSLFGLLAFWVEDIRPILWLVDKSVMMLGGSYLPVALMPPLMYQIALFSPFGLANLATHTVYELWQASWFFLLGMQVIWVMVLGGCALWLFARARQKVSVNGG